jgi:hypothetical protein
MLGANLKFHGGKMHSNFDYGMEMPAVKFCDGIMSMQITTVINCYQVFFSFK